MQLPWKPSPSFTKSQTFPYIFFFSFFLSFTENWWHESFWRRCDRSPYPTRTMIYPGFWPSFRDLVKIQVPTLFNSIHIWIFSSMEKMKKEIGNWKKPETERKFNLKRNRSCIDFTLLCKLLSGIQLVSFCASPSTLRPPSVHPPPTSR